jgi:predicted phosphate transport protein (TIGR00153 family)
LHRFHLLPREEKFFDLFEESAQNLVRAACLFAELLQNWEDVEEKIRQLTELEHHGDNITHRIIAQLHGTFVTPIDREDIAQLAQRMDDVMDFIEAAAVRIVLYGIDKPTERAKEVADVLVRVTTEVGEAIPRLRHRRELSHMREHCIEINRLENEADAVRRSALAELFHEQVDVTNVIKWMEIYENMENAVDSCEDIADILEGVMIKRA